MKKSFIMAVAAIAVLSSCSGDNDIVNENQNKNANAPVFTATIEGDEATRTTIGTGSETNKKKVNWESTDKVSINGAVYTVSPGAEDATIATLTKKSGEATPTGPFKAYYPSTMYSEGKAILPAEYKYNGNFNMPMYAESSDTQLAFKNLCGVLAIKVPSTEISSVLTVEVFSDQQLNGEFTASASGVLTFATKPVVEEEKKVTLKFDYAKTISDTEIFYVPIPAGDHKPLTIRVSNAQTTKVMRTKISTAVYVARNKIYNIDFAANMDPNLLIGIYSVSATKKVQFTKGNLMATFNSSTGSYTWDFFSSQDNYRGGGEFLKGNTTIDNQENNAVVDLFGWSTTSTDYGINTSEHGYDYIGEYRDWGTLFPDKNYSTLTNDEWSYLLNGRTCTNRFAKARILSHYGLLIFPDNYNGTTEVTGTGIAQVNSTTAAFPTDEMDYYTWKDIESYGVVFLPAAGYRSGSQVSFENEGGYYWSSVGTSEVRDTSGGRELFFYAYQLCFHKDNVISAESHRSVGKTVRLVSTITK